MQEKYDLLERLKEMFYWLTVDAVDDTVVGDVTAKYACLYELGECMKTIMNEWLPDTLDAEMAASIKEMKLCIWEVMHDSRTGHAAFDNIVDFNRALKTLEGKLIKQ